MTFKQVMGFVMMGTVVFLFNSIGIKYVVPIMALLVTISFACWWVGRISMGAELPAKLRGWAMGAVFVVVGWAVLVLHPDSPTRIALGNRIRKLPWRKRSQKATRYLLTLRPTGERLAN